MNNNAAYILFQFNYFPITSLQCVAPYRISQYSDVVKSQVAPWCSFCRCSIHMFITNSHQLGALAHLKMGKNIHLNYQEPNFSIDTFQTLAEVTLVDSQLV